MAGYRELMTSSNTIYRGKIVNLRVDEVSLPNGKTSRREVVEHAGAVAIVPINEKRELLLVRQYRYAAGMVLLEIPAGKLEPGEDYEACAGRELTEETGYVAGKLKHMISFYSTPGFTNEQIHLFLATQLTLKKQNLDEDEFIEVETVGLEQAQEMVMSGAICDAKSIAGILAAPNFLE
ncbi:MAG: NUDIX hydrolase [Peptococcaceae bacterium]|nr:NUDIX hydrolase [Candidatus Syntrophopropionicum ammoniitolerans]